MGCPSRRQHPGGAAFNVSPTSPNYRVSRCHLFAEYRFLDSFGINNPRSSTSSTVQRHPLLPAAEIPAIRLVKRSYDQNYGRPAGLPRVPLLLLELGHAGEACPFRILSRCSSWLTIGLGPCHRRAIRRRRSCQKAGRQPAGRWPGRSADDRGHRRSIAVLVEVREISSDGAVTFGMSTSRSRSRASSRGQIATVGARRVSSRRSTRLTTSGSGEASNSTTPRRFR